MKWLRLTWVILGSIIGAGFATGKELYVFFAQYGVKAYYGVGIFLLMFFGTTYMCLISKNDTRINKIMAVILVCGAVIMSASMIGAIVYITQANWLKKYLLTITIAGVAYVVSNSNVKYIYRLNSIMVPVIIISILIILLVGQSVESCNTNSINLFSPIIYLGINSCFMVFFLKNQRNKYTHKEKIVSCILSTIVLGIIMVIAVSCIRSNTGMPLLDMAYSINDWVGIYMKVIIALAGFTTLIITTYSIDDYIKINKKIALLLVLGPSAILSLTGFGNIINHWYTYLGVMGIFAVYYATQ